jgi:hypothetical protein
MLRGGVCEDNICAGGAHAAIFWEDGNRNIRRDKIEDGGKRKGENGKR